MLMIARTATGCPMPGCPIKISSSTVLSHFLRYHCGNTGLGTHEISRRRALYLTLEPNTLPFGRNVCLGVLLYDAAGDNIESDQYQRGILLKNNFLPETHEQYHSHLPVLVMACKTSLKAYCVNMTLEEKLLEPEDVKEHVLIIWLACWHTARQVYCGLDFFTIDGQTSRCIETKIRRINDSQNANEFVVTDVAHKLLCHADIKALTSEGVEPINMEIFVNWSLEN